jgi:hypothetical protein
MSKRLPVIMPNDPGIRNVPWETYKTTVDAVEALSGYDLLSLLPDPIEIAVEAIRNRRRRSPTSYNRCRISRLPFRALRHRAIPTVTPDICMELRRRDGSEGNGDARYQIPVRIPCA